SPSCGPIREDLHRCVSFRRAHDPAAWMRRRSAHVEIGNRRAILRPSWCGTQKEQLLEGQLALKDVALRQAPLALEIERGDHLAMANDVADVGRVFGECVHDGVTE